MKRIIIGFLIYWSLLATSFAEPNFVQGAENILEVVGYELINEQRIDLKVFEYTYKITLKNVSGESLKNVAASFFPMKKDEFGQEYFDGFSGMSDGAGFPFGEVLITVGNPLHFNDLAAGETKQSNDTFSFRYDRTKGILDLNQMAVLAHWTKELAFTDVKNNQIQFFTNNGKAIRGHSNGLIGRFSFENKFIISLSDVDIIKHQNSSNISNVDDFPFITDQYIEITFPTGSSGRKVQFKIKYTQDPYRLFLVNEGKAKWATFTKDTTANIATFSTFIDNNNKIIFALVGEYQ